MTLCKSNLNKKLYKIKAMKIMKNPFMKVITFHKIKCILRENKRLNSIYFEKESLSKENNALKKEIKELTKGIENLKKCSHKNNLIANLGDDFRWSYRYSDFELDEKNVTDYKLIRSVLYDKERRFSDLWRENNRLDEEIKELRDIKEKYIHLKASVKILKNGQLKGGRNA